MDRKQLAITYAKRTLVDMIYSSANVEGLGATFPNIESILEGLPVTCTTDEVMFILNMRDAYRFLFDNIDYPNNIMFIRQLNSIVGNRLIYGSGKLRTINVTIGGTTWTPDIPIESVVIDAVHEIDRLDNSIAKALAFFCYLSRSQLFIDGNKRVAQLMANKVLIESGTGILDIPVNHINEFKTELIRFYETGKADGLCKLLVETSLQLL